MSILLSVLIAISSVSGQAAGFVPESGLNSGMMASIALEEDEQTTEYTVGQLTLHAINEDGSESEQTFVLKYDVTAMLILVASK